MPGIHQQLQEGTPQLISNSEVLEILMKRPPTPPRKRHRPASRVAKKVKEYLQKTPCTRIESSKCKELLQKLQSQKKRGLLPSPPPPPPPSNGDNVDIPTPSTSSTLSTGFGLTHAEAIQCLNIVPTEPVEIHLLIEDLQARLSDRQQEELLDLIRSYDTQKGGPATAKKRSNGRLENQEEETPAADSEDAMEEDSKPAAAEMKAIKKES